jgi:uncharacterized membrane protein
MTAEKPVKPPPVPDDARVLWIELVISRLLRIGVITSLAVVLLGTVLTFVHHPEYTRSAGELPRLITPDAAFPHSPGQVLAGLREFQGRSLVILGLLLLILTPVLRVAVSIFLFVYERDRVFVLITSVVLAMLLLSFVVGRAQV